MRADSPRSRNRQRAVRGLGAALLAGFSQLPATTVFAQTGAETFTRSTSTAATSGVEEILVISRARNRVEEHAGRADLDYAGPPVTSCNA